MILYLNSVKMWPRSSKNWWNWNPLIAWRIIMIIFNIIINENRVDFPFLRWPVASVYYGFWYYYRWISDWQNSPDHTTPSILHISQSSSRTKLKNESAPQNISSSAPNLLGNLANRLSNHISLIFYILDFPSSDDWERKYSGKYSQLLH